MKKLISRFLFVLCLFAGSGFSVIASDKLPQADGDVLLQEANSLFIDGIVKQAKDKYSAWLEDNNKSADNKKIAQVLVSRASTSMLLGEENDAQADLEQSIVYDPLGGVQLGICLLKKMQVTEVSNLENCYVQAVQMFKDQGTDKHDINLLAAQILSGDKSAIIDYKNILETINDPRLLKIYKMAAQAFFDESICLQILPDCSLDKLSIFNSDD